MPNTCKVRQLLPRLPLDAGLSERHFLPAAYFRHGHAGSTETGSVRTNSACGDIPGYRLDAVCEQINASGYGLTFSLHSRIDQTADFVRQRIRVGNIYVNRNQIGAVVEAQPFGGERLSGTGPKAGGPHYLPRFAVERTFTVNTAAAGGNTTPPHVSRTTDRHFLPGTPGPKLRNPRRPICAGLRGDADECDRCAGSDGKRRRTRPYDRLRQ